jgi:peptidoglycan pentaglycine glycine transferase (the first glycine)
MKEPGRKAEIQILLNARRWLMEVGKNKERKTLPGSISCQYSIDIRDDAWDQFVISFPEPHHEQTSIWAELRCMHGWVPWRLILRNENLIIGGIQVLEFRFNRFLRVGYIPRGPLLTDQGLASYLFEILKTYASKRHIDYLALSLPYFAYPIISQAIAAGFSQRPDELPPSIWVKATLIKDLDQNEAALFQEMRSKTRNNIRKGLQSDIVVRDGTRDDIPAFTDLVEKLCKRRGVTSNMPLGDFPLRLWDEFHSKNLLHLFVAECGQNLVAGMILITLGAWATAWRIGWGGDHPEKYPTKLIIWKAIQWARNRGYRYFDFLGLDIDDATALLGGRSKSEPFKCGITFSKVGMGGQIHLLAGEYCYFVNPLFRQVFNHGGKQLMRTGYFSKMANSLYKIGLLR